MCMYLAKKGFNVGLVGLVGDGSLLLQDRDQLARDLGSVNKAYRMSNRTMYLVCIVCIVCIVYIVLCTVIANIGARPTG